MGNTQTVTGSYDMAARRFTVNEMPVKAVSLATAKLYQEDIDFIISRGQHPRTIIREALHAYCEAWRSQLETVPALKVTPKIRPVPLVPAAVRTRTPRVAPDIMSTWSKPERDEYIITGKIPPPL